MKIRPGSIDLDSFLGLLKRFEIDVEKSRLEWIYKPWCREK